MEYVNFNVSIPVFAYLKLEGMAKTNNSSKNEIINKIILSWISCEREDLRQK